MDLVLWLYRKGIVLRDTCDYPTTSNAYFTRVSEPKLSEYLRENKILHFGYKKYTNKSIYR